MNKPNYYQAQSGIQYLDNQLCQTHLLIESGGNGSKGTWVLGRLKHKDSQDRPWISYISNQPRILFGLAFCLIGLGLEAILRQAKSYLSI